MKKRAFSLIEIVMVIVVLGVVAMIGTDIITKMYEGYIKSKVINKLQSKTDQVLELIAKRLTYRIKDSVVTSKDGLSYLKLSETGITVDHNVLEWIGYDYEGMVGDWNGSTYVGWSGFIDLDDTATNTKTEVKTSGSDLNLAKKSIDALSYGTIDFASLTGGVGLISKCSYNTNLKAFGFDGGGGSNVVKVGINSKDVLSIYNPTYSPIEYCEQYYLARSAYAIVPESNSNDFNLTLRYNYQPWLNEKYNDVNTTKQLLAEHVSTFRFIQVGHTLRVKLCMRDPQTNYGFCKEKAIY